MMHKMQGYIGVFLTVFLFTGCTFTDSSMKIKSSNDSLEEGGSNQLEYNNLPLNENKAVYMQDKDDEVVSFYVTIKYSKDRNVRRRDTINSLNSYTGQGEKPELEVIVQEGKEGSGPSPGSFAYGETTANAVMTLRGGSKNKLEPKSYKLRLNDRAGLWRGQKVLNLNKHLDDLTRMKNKFSMDIYKKMSDVAGFRTTFVHLYIKDTTEGNSIGDFTGDKNSTKENYVDYGLYTHVEQPNKDYLRSRGFDVEGVLYEAENFNFTLDDKEELEKRIEIREGKDYSKLNNMLKDLNDDGQEINAVFDKYFDRENYLTWMATNILFGNLQVGDTGYLLYSPRYSAKLYFLPWDSEHILFSKAITRKSIPPPSWQTAYLYKDNLLHRRFLGNPANMKSLQRKINEIWEIYLSKSSINKAVGLYKNVVNKYIANIPDIATLPGYVEDAGKHMDSFADMISENRDSFINSEKLPRPVYMKDVQYIGEQSGDQATLEFSWESYPNVNGDDISYNFLLATDPEFTNTIVNLENIKETSCTIAKPPEEIYYWRIISSNSKKEVQLPANIAHDIFGRAYYGSKLLDMKQLGGE